MQNTSLLSPFFAGLSFKTDTEEITSRAIKFGLTPVIEELAEL